MKKIKTYENKNILILGLGKSGFSVAKLLLKLGAKLTLNDKKDLSKDSVLVSNIDLKSSGQDDEFQEEFLIELNHVCNFKKPSEDIADNFLVEIPLDKKNFN